MHKYRRVFIFQLIGFVRLFFLCACHTRTVTRLFNGCDYASSLALPSTPIEFVSRLTEQDCTPSTFETAFSTWELQAAQLIPVTLNFFIKSTYLISFCKVATRSSIVSSLPLRISSATQVLI